MKIILYTQGRGHSPYKYTSTPLCFWCAIYSPIAKMPLDTACRHCSEIFEDAHHNFNHTRDNYAVCKAQAFRLSATYIPKKGPLWVKASHPSLLRQEANLSEDNKENVDPQADPKCDQSEEEGHDAANGGRTVDCSGPTHPGPKAFCGQRWPNNGNVVSNQKEA